MPNHVTTRCTVTGPAADVAAFRERMITTENDERGKPQTWLNFERIIPMPEVTRSVTENGTAGDVLAILCESSTAHLIWENLRRFAGGEKLGAWKGLAFSKRGEMAELLEAAFPGCVANAKAMAASFGTTGYKSWYDWSVAHWGTKWNSYGFCPVTDEPLQFLFDTAWSFPTPVFEALAQEYPRLQFHCLTYDEGGGFAGEGYFNPGTGQTAFHKVEASDDMYRRVYGREPDRDETDAA